MDTEFDYTLIRKEPGAGNIIKYRWWSSEKQIWSKSLDRDAMHYVLASKFEVNDVSVSKKSKMCRDILMSSKIEWWQPNQSRIVPFDHKKVYDLENCKVMKTDISLMLDYELNAKLTDVTVHAEIYLSSLTDNYAALKECLGYMLIPRAAKVYTWEGTECGKSTLLRVLECILGSNMRHGDCKFFPDTGVCYTNDVVRTLEKVILNRMSVMVMDINFPYPSDGQLLPTVIQFRKLEKYIPDMYHQTVSIRDQIFQVMIDSAVAILHQ
jgi:hypothetical protein